MSQEAVGSHESGPQQDNTNSTVVFVDGVRLHKFRLISRPIEEQLECIKALEMREDDILLCTYPRCGTNWTWEIASMLISGKAEHLTKSKEFSRLESMEIESTQSKPSPRFLNTHLPTRMLPAQVKDKKVKVIHVYRNMKDVIVSMYYQERYEGTFENYVKDAIENNRYISYLQSMDKFIEDNPDHPIFNVSYEEMKQDHEGTVRRLGEFLGVKTTPELCADITRATSFNNMKEADKNKIYVPIIRPENYRKGIVGDWKYHMTVAQSEAVDAVVKQLDGCRNLHFPCTL